MARDTNHKSVPSELLLVVGVVFGISVLMKFLLPLWGVAGHQLLLMAILFVGVPTLVLDRRGKPYRRYGMFFSNPLKDLPLLLALMCLTFTPIVGFILLFPAVWGVENVVWQWQFPSLFLASVATQFVAIALPEEFFFRGYLQGRLDDLIPGRKRVLGSDVGWSVVIAAAIFALGHLIYAPSVFRLLVFFPGLVFGWLRVKCDNITAPIIYHGCSNLFMLIFQTGFGL